MSNHYAAGDEITVDGILYAVGEAAEAYSLSDPEGNEVIMTLAQIEEGLSESEDTEEEEGPVDLSKVDVKTMGPKAREKMMAKLKKEAGL